MTNMKLAERLLKSDARKIFNDFQYPRRNTPFNKATSFKQRLYIFEQQFDEKIELNEGALFDARQVAEEANHKYEETARKVKIVTHQLACIIERAEDFEANSRETEIKVRVSH